MTAPETTGQGCDVILVFDSVPSLLDPGYVLGPLDPRRRPRWTTSPPCPNYVSNAAETHSINATETPPKRVTVTHENDPDTR